MKDCWALHGKHRKCSAFLVGGELLLKSISVDPCCFLLLYSKKTVIVCPPFYWIKSFQVAVTMKSLLGLPWTPLQCQEGKKSWSCLWWVFIPSQDCLLWQCAKILGRKEHSPEITKSPIQAKIKISYRSVLSLCGQENYWVNAFINARKMLINKWHLFLSNSATTFSVNWCERVSLFNCLCNCAAKEAGRVPG